MSKQADKEAEANAFGDRAVVEANVIVRPVAMKAPQYGTFRQAS